MRFPSIKTLLALVDNSITPDAIKIARLIGTSNSSETITKHSARAREYAVKTPRASMSMTRMTALNEVLGMYGIEPIYANNGSCVALYLNTGDIYAPTIIRYDGKYRVQSVGDFVEVMERRGVRFK